MRNLDFRNRNSGCCSNIDQNGSIFDDSTTDREISTRSIDLRRRFILIISRDFGVENSQKIPIWKAESQENLISKTRGPEDSSISRYDDFESGSWNLERDRVTKRAVSDCHI